MIHLKRYDWGAQQHTRVPVDEDTLQEIVDAVFRSTRLWQEDPERWERQIRLWQAKLWAVPGTPTHDSDGNPLDPRAEVIAELRALLLQADAEGIGFEAAAVKLGLLPEPVPVGRTQSAMTGPITWKDFLAEQRADGKSMKEAAALWKARKE